MGRRSAAGADQRFDRLASVLGRSGPFTARLLPAKLCMATDALGLSYVAVGRPEGKAKSIADRPARLVDGLAVQPNFAFGLDDVR